MTTWDELRAMPHLPHFFAVTYAKMADAARALGWGLSLHGSLRRDCDIIAVPWIDEAAPMKQMLAAIAHEAGGWLDDRATAKPHGRVAWVIALGGPWIDVSVIDGRGIR